MRIRVIRLVHVSTYREPDRNKSVKRIKAKCCSVHQKYFISSPKSEEQYRSISAKDPDFIDLD
jgi:hypothetical protein